MPDEPCIRIRDLVKSFDDQVVLNGVNLEVYPGETIRTEMWRDDNIVSFRARVVERDVVVLNNGRAEVG